MAMSIFNLQHAQALMYYLLKKVTKNYGLSASEEPVSLIFGGDSLFNN